MCLFIRSANTNPALPICLCFMSLHNTDMHIMGILKPLRVGFPGALHNLTLRLVNMSLRNVPVSVVTRGIAIGKIQ